MTTRRLATLTIQAWREIHQEEGYVTRGAMFLRTTVARIENDVFYSGTSPCR